ncbi:PREDICTED: wall-associated receptor kinase 1-like [Tarenaya hassleriana]|uniref:wall-associated receptor kinase 1-like n=1 Tax=Tarenaya hassleriana TaxID=28532 RepID=UPI00053C426D|nr:PREDICTED: wall-associated receptor kinase 1-like [Tarenaya hassleriana]
MLLQTQVILLQFLFLILGLESASTGGLALPGCSDKCGNISIPYPFGIGRGCYLGDAYAVECHAPNLLLLWESRVSVLNLTLEGYIRLALNVSYKCRDLKSNNSESSEPSYSFTRFAISPTSNKLTGVGCGGFVTMMDMDNMQNQFSCATMTNQSHGMIDGKCNGYDCCQLPISGNISRFLIQTTIPSNPDCAPWPISCHYAFLVEDEGYEFRSSDLLVLRESRERPVLFNCLMLISFMDILFIFSMVFIFFNFLRKCNNILTPGYLCNCTEGYQGNPYLKNGCQGTCHPFIIFLVYSLNSLST